MAEELSKKVLMGFIIISIVAVVMFLFIDKVRQEFGSLSEKELCKKSVELQAKQKSFITVKGSHLTDTYGNPVDLKCSTNYESIGSKDEGVIKRTIANSMFDCWDQYGRGEIEIFDTRDQNYCVVCSSLEFTNKKEINDFTQFLVDNKPNAASEQTYFEYLTGIKAEDNKVIEKYENSELKEKDVVDLTNPLAVMFVMDKNAYPDAKLGVEEGKAVTTVVGAGGGVLAGFFTGIALCGTGIGCIAGAGIIVTAVGALTGYTIGSDSSAEWDARVLLWDYNKIDELDCTYLEGKSTPIRPI